MFSILNEIGNNSHFRTTSVVVASIGTSAAIYVLVAITGYLSFGNSIGGNVAGMYPPGLTATIGRAAIVVLVMFSYPLQVHPCRASVDAVLKWRWNRKPTSSSSADSSPPRNIPLLPQAPSSRKPSNDSMGETRFAAITTVIIVLSYIVAMTVSSLEAVLAYVGSTGSTSISFILPGLFYYKISDPDSPHHQTLMKSDDDEDFDDEDNASEGEGLLSGSGLLRRLPFWRRDLLRKLSLALAIYGIVVMVVCLITNTFFIASH
jgi:amino acid permease